MKRWAEKEMLFIEANFRVLTDESIGTRLDRTAKSVKQKRTRLGFHIGRELLKEKNAKSGKHKNIEGEKNPCWRGGISKNNYHYKKIQMERYPERIRARVAIIKAIKSGKIQRLSCEKCGEKNAHAHHDDYSRPLDVRFLCRKHHREIHGGKH